MSEKVLSVIIPVYNEEQTLTQILDKVLLVKLEGIAMELVIVNDCSTDRSAEVMESYVKDHPGVSISLFHQEKNKGKGAAIHSGIQEGTREFLII